MVNFLGVLLGLFCILIGLIVLVGLVFLTVTICAALFELIFRGPVSVTLAIIAAVMTLAFCMTY